MNNFSEADRIEQFEKLMNPYISKEFRNWLIANGFFTAPASIHHHGAYTGALFDHSFAVTPKRFFPSQNGLGYRG